MPTPRFALILFASMCGCAASGSASFSSGSGTLSPEPGSSGKPARAPDAGAPAPGEAAAPGQAAGAGAPSGVAAAPPPCAPALADAPTSLFGTRIVIRLPKGVELAERNPFYAQSAAPGQRSNCGQPISYAAVGFFEYPANSAVTAVRDQIVSLRGIPSEGLAWSDEGARGRSYTGAYAAPEDPKTGAPPVQGWFVLREAGDKYAYFALYETEPASWEALREVFVASGRNLLIKPRSQQPAQADAAAGAKPPASAGAISAQPADAKGSKAK